MASQPLCPNLLADLPVYVQFNKSGVREGASKTKGNHRKTNSPEAGWADSMARVEDKRAGPRLGRSDASSALGLGVVFPVWWRRMAGSSPGSPFCTFCFFSLGFPAPSFPLSSPLDAMTLSVSRNLRQGLAVWPSASDAFDQRGHITGVEGPFLVLPRPLMYD